MKQWIKWKKLWNFKLTEIFVHNDLAKHSLWHLLINSLSSPSHWLSWQKQTVWDSNIFSHGSIRMFVSNKKNADGSKQISDGKKVLFSKSTSKLCYIFQSTMDNCFPLLLVNLFCSLLTWVAWFDTDIIDTVSYCQLQLG